jgi:chromosome segregation ATPase
MKTTVISILLLAFFALTACNYNEDKLAEKDKEIATLKELQDEKMKEINFFEAQTLLNNQVLDSVSASISSLKNETLKKEEAVERINEIDEKLKGAVASCLNRIAEIEKSSIEDPFRRVLIRNLQQQLSSLETQKTWIGGIKTDVEALKSQNVSLMRIIQKREQELIAKDNIIMQIKAEREAQNALLAETKGKIREFEKTLADKESQLADAKKETENTKTEAKADKGKTLYEEGLKMYENFQAIQKNITIGREKKSKALKDALASFKKGYETYGNTDAHRKMLEIQNNEKLQKFLEE